MVAKGWVGSQASLRAKEEGCEKKKKRKKGDKD